MSALPAQACTPQFAKGQTANLMLDVGNIVLSPGAPPGSNSYRHAFAWNAISDSGEQWITCDDRVSEHHFTFRSRMSGIPYLPRVFRTNLKGIGIRVSLRAPGGYDGFPLMPTAAPFIENVRWRSSAGSRESDNIFRVGQFRLRVELLKMRSNVQSGQLDYRQEGFLYADKLRVANLAVKGNVIVGACTVASSESLHVTLPARALSDFGRIGRTSGETPFALQLNCNSSVGIRLRLEGREAPGRGRQGVLKNDQSGEDRARGVGVQLLYQHQPVALHRNINLGVATAGNYAIEMGARYYQTHRRISAGAVSAVATYTLVYY
ncbi:TPA: fimbrial protein [Citrobacter freundii]